MPDGTRILIGRLMPSDAPLLASGFARLSAESRRLRFLVAKPSLSESELRYLTHVDGHWHEALGAIDPGTGDGIAVGRFIRNRDDPSRAEVAITVADDWQRRGLGTLVLGRLTERAREEGVERFTALVSTENQGMHALLDGLEAPARVTRVRGNVGEYEIELAPKGLGAQLEGALRGAAAGRLRVPPRILEALRALVPIHFNRE